MKRAFTLVELLVVIAIIAILSAVLFPVFVAAKGAAYQMVAVSNLRQLGEASLMYVADNDETFMPALGMDDKGEWAWFGRATFKGVDESAGLLVSYQGKRKLADPIAKAKDYMGDHSGFGYNWGYVGSDLHISRQYQEYPFCWYPARLSELAHPSTTVTFASSNYYAAKWEGGDGQDYDFGFIDPIGSRPNNPNVDFRHVAKKKIERNKVVSPGNAIVTMADGRARTAKEKALKDSWFVRDDVP